VHKILTHKGFTLIELLIVIAIIGVLSSIIITSLNNARSKAKDAKIKSTMQQMRNQAELFYIKYGSYYGTNPAGWANDDIGECRVSPSGVGTLLDANINESITSLELAVHNESTGTGLWRIYCGVGNSTHDSWAFAAPLYNPTSGNKGWCVDSSGISKNVNTDFINPGFQVGGMSTFAKCP